MSQDLKETLQKARDSYKNSDDVGTVSWLTRATGTVPQASNSDEDYEKVFQRLSDFVTKGGKK